MSAEPPNFAPVFAESTSISNEEQREPILRRSSLDIMFDILRAIRDGPGGKEIPTRIMMKSNLSYTICMRVVKRLESAGLIQSERKYMGGTKKNDYHLDGPELRYDKKKGQKIISLTEKGISVIQSYEKILDEINAEKKFRKTPLLKRSRGNRGFKTHYADGSSKTIGRGFTP